ncbi:MAG: UDP-N-acetylglucosamine pyrophosphorylase [Clostridia bacterium]|nr:UDP-N-acetylglucosamine pyrophosphorylase [Clostridia bacterium]MEE1024718.1 UDP-N-acetylglucosamine pyrophosphorylase [Acutalibacteraceae bacterium]
MKELEINNLLDLSKTIAASLFSDKTYPYEVLPLIGEYIVKLQASLDKNEFNIAGDVYIHKTAKVAPSASINGPCIIDAGAEVRHCAFVRGNAIVGKNSVVGNSTELKNVVLFDNVQVPHYNYVGDSVLGYKSHMGAGSIASNLKSDKSLVCVNVNGSKVPTGLKKFGIILGDNVEVGCGSVLNPGTVIGRNTNVYPLSAVRGYIPKNSIYKKAGEIAEKR